MAKIKQIFVAGPYSGDISNNSDLCLELAIQVAAAGAMPHCPNVYKDPRFMQVQPYEFWIEATKGDLAGCDGIIFTPNFKESNGARGEEEFAIANSIPCFYSIEELKKFLNDP